MNIGIKGASAGAEVTKSKKIKNKQEIEKNEEVKQNKKTEPKEEDLEFFQDLLNDGVLQQRKILGLFKTNEYIYTADGKKSFAEIKEQIDLEDGALRRSNHDLFKDIEGNADEYVPKKGTKITIAGKDIKPQQMEVKDNNGKDVKGFYKNMTNGEVFYEIQHGDTKESIYKKFENDALEDYRTADILDRYSEYTLKPGIKIVLPEKTGIEKIFS